MMDGIRLSHRFSRILQGYGLPLDSGKGKGVLPIKMHEKSRNEEGLAAT